MYLALHCCSFGEGAHLYNISHCILCTNPSQCVSTHQRKVKHFYFGQNLNVIFVNVFQDRDAAGATALHLAARFGCVDVIKWLLSVGGGAQVETNCRAVPAHYSAASGDLTCLKLLIQQAPG